MGYRRDTVGDIIGYVCDCGAPYRSYSAWHLHNKRTHDESKPQTTYSEPETEAREPTEEESKAGISVAVFIAGMILVIIYFKGPIMEWLGITGDNSAMVYSVNGGDIL